MPPYEIRITKQAKKEIEQLTPKLRQKLRTILVEIIAPDPHSGKQLVVLYELTSCTVSKKFNRRFWGLTLIF